MKRVWVLGIGPLMVPRQFLQDVGRMDIYLYNQLLPKNAYDALEQLYLCYHSDYYFYTMYATQYMGNRTYDALRIEHLVCRSISLHLYDHVEARMVFDVYSKELKWQRSFSCRSIKTKTDFLIYL
tara:strand:- start:584 stop:958 length:375 start_codon:yes stop_codon:yes gene_type:complete